MTQDLQDLERDIEQSRAKLDMTIDRLQDKMSVSGVVDDVLGTARSGGYGPLFDNVLETVRRNPVPVMLIAMGIGLLAHRLGRTPTVTRRRSRLVAKHDARHDFVADEDVVVGPEGTRVYGAGATPLQPADETFDHRQSVNSRI